MGNGENGSFSEEEAGEPVDHTSVSEIIFRIRRGRP